MPQRTSNAQSGKQWLEFLAQEINLNAVELKDAIYRTNREPGEAGDMSTGTIKGQFTERRQPSKEFKALVRRAFSQLIANGKLGTWRDDLHSYEAFCASDRVITAPMRVNRQHLRTVPAYIGSYALYRKTFEDGIGVDYISVLAPRSSGAYPIDWWIKEVVDGSAGYFLHHGFGYLSSRDFGIDVARANSERDARVVRMSVSRNEADHTTRLIGVKLGCCAIDGAPRSCRVYLTKLADRPLAEADWQRVVHALEHDIRLNGPGSMQFPEVDASNNSIRDIPDRLLKVGGDTIRRAADEGGRIEPKVATRARRNRA